MDRPERLVTSCDVAPDHGDSLPDGRQMSLTALHHLELTSGRRVVLLDDRGWTASGPPDIWSHTSLEDIDETTRMVVGPDEPPPGRSYEQMDADHWADLAATTASAGVHVQASTLAALPHHVEISQAVRERVAHSTP